MSVEIFAAESGSATIRANANGSYVSGYCAVTVKQEFRVYENVYLRSYTGRGGDWVNENGEVEHNVVEIPDDLGVAYIYPGAFQGNKYIRKVIIPEGITTIMRGAFVNCENLEEVVLPTTVESIDKITFAYCSNLKKINLENVHTIGDSSFWNCTSLEEVNLDKCTYIDKYAFHYCTGLKTLNLGRVGIIGGGAFFLCTGLETLTIPANTSMDYDTTYYTGENPIDRGAAFGYCFGLKQVTIKSKNVGLHAFRGCTGLESVVFENDVNTISALAFNSCTSLKSVTFHGSLYKVEDAAFSYCTSLESFTFPKGTTILGNQLFIGSNDLKNISVSSGARLENIGYNSLGGVSVASFSVEDGNKYLSSEDGVLYDRAKKVLLAYPGKKSGTEFKVPASVKTIGRSAFANVPTLQTIDLTNVEYIEEGAFTNAKRVAYDDKGEVQGYYYSIFKGFDNVKYIGAGAFERCAFVQLPIGDKVTYIGDYAFANCSYATMDATGLPYDTAFTAPRGLKYLGAYAFGGTTYSYEKEDDENSTDTGATTRETVTVDISAPFRSVSFAGSAITKVGEGAFNNCVNLTSVNFGNLTEISDNMFASCRSLRIVTIPATVKIIGNNAFKDCTSLATVNLTNSTVTHIAAGAFRKTALTSVTMPLSVDSVGEYAFEGTPLKTVNLNRVTKIGNYAFANTELTSVVSDNGKDFSVTTVGNGAFRNCASLKSVELPYAVTIGNRAFENCEALATLNIDSANIIGAQAFKGAKALEAVDLKNATDIGNEAFYGAEKVEEIGLNSLVNIGSEAFYGTAITRIALPATMNKIADKAFYGIEGLTEFTVADANKMYKSLDGVLYSVNDKNFYTLVSYPAGKTGTSYDVYSRTVKVGAYAFNSNKYLESISLPAYMQVIGASAMSGMSSLESVTIYATAAPTLESNTRKVLKPTVTDPEPGDDGEDNEDSVNVKTTAEDPGIGDDPVEGDDPDRVEEILNPDDDPYYYVNYYDNFNFEYEGDGGVGKTLKIYIPINNSGYDNRIWNNYVGKIIESLDSIHILLGTLEYIDDIKAALDNPDVTSAEISSLVRIYNMLSTVQQNFVTGNYEYSDATGSIDKEYYDKLLGGRNYYKELLDLQNGTRNSDPVGFGGLSARSDDSSVDSSTNYVGIVIAFAMLLSLVSIALVAAAKRRSGR